MKCIIATTTVVLLALTGAALCDPVSIRDNNVGDIVSVGVNLKANIDTNIETNVVNILVALLTKLDELKLHLPSSPQGTTPPEVDHDHDHGRRADVPKLDVLSSAIGDVRNLVSQPGLSKEAKDTMLREKLQQFVDKMKASKQ